MEFSFIESMRVTAPGKTDNAGFLFRFREEGLASDARSPSATKCDPVIIAEIVLCQMPMQMFFAAVLVHTFRAAFEC